MCRMACLRSVDSVQPGTPTYSPSTRIATGICGRARDGCPSSVENRFSVHENRGMSDGRVSRWESGHRRQRGMALDSGSRFLCYYRLEVKGGR